MLLIPTLSNDARAAAEAIYNEWVTLFGWFKEISSDRGAAFTNEVIRRIYDLFNIKQNLAEARNHRSIGKVERVIKILQEALQKWNLELEGLLSDDTRHDDAIEAIKIAIKPIQAGINARISRVHQLSANQLMFGAELTELEDINQSINKLDELKQQQKQNASELGYLNQLQKQLKMFNDVAVKNRDKYVKIMKKDYDKRLNKMDITYHKGDLVLYYIGDQNHRLQKLRAKWSGPWIVSEMLNDNTVILSDTNGEYVWPVHVERVKRYKRSECYGLDEYLKKVESGEIKELRNIADKV